MSHLSHLVCGVDVYLSYNRFNSTVRKLVENLKTFFNKNQITFYSNDHIEFNENYLRSLQVQSIRSKIFLYFVDTHSLECEWFLYNFIYAHSHNQLNHLPILLPVIFNQEIESEPLNKSKQKIFNQLIKDCIVYIKMSEIKSFDSLTTKLREVLVDIVPFKSQSVNSIRFADNFRPLYRDEELFLKRMQSKEIDLMKKFELSNDSFKSQVPKGKVVLSLSIPYDELNSLVTKMIFLQYHLIWMDVISTNKVNYFSLLWTSNEHEQFKVKSSVKKDDSATSTSSSSVMHQATPPLYLIYYDLNSAQLARIYKERCIDDTFNLELVESYVKPVNKFRTPNANQKTSNHPAEENSITEHMVHGRRLVKSAAVISATLSTSKKASNQHKVSSSYTTSKVHEEIFYICQIKRIVGHNAATHKLNKIQHSIVDSRFHDRLREMVKFNYSQNYMPFKLSPILLHHSSYKHFYYTTLYKAIDKRYYIDEEGSYSTELLNNGETTNFYSIHKKLNDSQLIRLHEEFKSNGWRLIDLKAYKNELDITCFSAIWTVVGEFYEGSSVLLVGLTKTELLHKVNEMKDKNLHAKIVTNYGYLNAQNEHVYAILFCQF